MTDNEERKSFTVVILNLEGEPDTVHIGGTKELAVQVLAFLSQLVAGEIEGLTIVRDR